jgi:hypothetical protein
MSVATKGQKVYVTVERDLVQSYFEGVEYGDWSEEWSCRVDGVSLSPNRPGKDIEAVDMSVPVNVGDEVFVLYMVYDTGDSFGSAVGKLEVLYVFKDKELAKTAKETVSASENETTLEFVVDNGKTLKLSNPGAGYFEHINDVDFEGFFVHS